MRRTAVMLGFVFLAATGQYALPHRVAFLGAEPDYMSLAACLIAMHSSRSRGASFGFLAGVFQGAIVGANLAHYAITRMAAAFVLSWTRYAKFEWRWPLVLLAVAGAHFVMQIAFMFLASPPSLGAFLADTIRTSAYNGVLALLVNPVLVWALGSTYQKRL